MTISQHGSSAHRRALHLARLTAAIAALLSATGSVHAATKTWLNAPTNNDLATGTNWNAAGTPLSGDVLAFGVSGTTNLTNTTLAAGFSIGGFQFNSGASAFTIGGPNSMTLAGGITSSATNTQTINLDLILNANRDVSVVSGGSVFLGGVVSGAFRLQAIGLGTVTLNGSAASTYSGGTSASGGGTFVVDLSNIGTDIAGHNNLLATTGSLNLGNGNSHGSGTFILKGAATGTSAQTLSGGINSLASGTAGLIVVNANGGSGTNLNLGTGVVRNAGSAVVFDISSTNASLTGTTLGLTAAAQTASQSIKGYALLTDATGTGFAANVGGALVRYTGATALTPGGAALTTTSTVNYSLAAGATNTTLAAGQTVNSLSIDTTGGTGFLNLGATILSVTTGGIVSSGSSALTITGGQLGANASELILHAIGSGGVTIGSTISGTTGSFTKTGSGTVTLSGTNTYSGVTYVLDGVLKGGATNSFSANSLLDLSTKDGVAVDLNGFDNTVGNITTGAPGGTGANVLLGSNTLTFGGLNTDANLYGVISGIGGNLVKNGTGNVSFRNGSNTYTGTTTVNNGILTARAAGNVFGVNSAFVIAAAGTVDLGFNSVSIGSLSGSGTITNNFSNGGNTSTLTVGGDNTSTIFSGAVTNGALNVTSNKLNLVKVGTGTQTLSGTGNNYTGTTVIKAGTLIVSGSLSASSVVTVGDSASLATTAVLGGNGTVGNVTLGAATGNTGARIDPGNGTNLTGVLTTGALTTNSGVRLRLQLGGLTAGTGDDALGYDRLVASAVTLGSGNVTLELSLVNSFSPQVNDKFFILVNSGAGSTTGTFANPTFSDNLGNTYAVNYADQFNGTGAFNDISLTVLTVVPEPSSAALLLGATGIFLNLRRRRRTIS